MPAPSVPWQVAQVVVKICCPCAFSAAAWPAPSFELWQPAVTTTRETATASAAIESFPDIVALLGGCVADRSRWSRSIFGPRILPS